MDYNHFKEKLLKISLYGFNKSLLEQLVRIDLEWDAALISLVRRSMPNLIAHDICGVQPMTGPTGLIFTMKSKYKQNDKEDESLF